MGHRIRMGGQRHVRRPWLTIVGVAKETSYSLWDQTPRAAVYMDALQAAPAATEYAITTDGNPLALAPAARKALASLDPLLPLNTVETYRQLLNDNLTGLMYAAGMLVMDGVIALLLAAIGIFAVMANLVGERTREIGVQAGSGSAARRCARHDPAPGFVAYRHWSLCWPGDGIRTGAWGGESAGRRAPKRSVGLCGHHHIDRRHRHAGQLDSRSLGGAHRSHGGLARRVNRILWPVVSGNPGGCTCRSTDTSPVTRSVAL